MTSGWKASPRDPDHQEAEGPEGEDPIYSNCRQVSEGHEGGGDKQRGVGLFPHHRDPGHAVADLPAFAFCLAQQHLQS